MGQGSVSCHGYSDHTQTVEQQTMLSGLLATASLERSDPPIAFSLFCFAFSQLASGSTQLSTDSCICYPQRNRTALASSTGIETRIRTGTRMRQEEGRGIAFLPPLPQPGPLCAMMDAAVSDSRIAATA
jgi:hypothetical protein